MTRKIKGLERGVAFVERAILKSLGTHFLSLSEIDQMVEDLTDQVSDYKPDCVVGVLNSGHYPGKKVAELLDCDYQGLDVSRDHVRIAGVSLNDRLLFNRFVGKRIFPTVKSSFQDEGYERVLVVDEDGGSGRTLNLVRSEIDKNSKAEVRDAALMLNTPGHVTDYSAGKFKRLNKFVGTTTRFPWFPCSPHYSEYLKRVSN